MQRCAKGGKEDSVNQGKGAEQGVSAGACKGVAKGGGKHDSTTKARVLRVRVQALAKVWQRVARRTVSTNWARVLSRGVSASAHKGVAKGSGKEVSINQGKGAEEGVSAGACKGVAKGCGKDPRAGDVLEGKRLELGCEQGKRSEGGSQGLYSRRCGMAGNGRGVEGVGWQR